MRELPEIRLDINAVDEQMRSLFLQRIALAREVAAAKAESGGKIFIPSREAEIIAARAVDMDEEIRLKYVALLQSIMRGSREHQYSQLLHLHPDRFPFHPVNQAFRPRSIYYQGVPGAYQELAARSLFPDCTPQHVGTWEHVFQAVRDGEVDAGVVPCENTTAGTVNEVYDLLLEYDLSINRSTVKKISHCLAALQGARIEDIRRVCSHPHALPQCGSFISRHGLETIQVSNTAIAAQNVSTQGDISLAAICSAEAAAHYGLSVLAEGVNDRKHNETRFIAVSRTLTVQQDDNRIEIAFHIPNVAGSLSAVLGIFADYGVDMTEIHSRPMKDSPWCYVFYIDFTGNLLDHAVRALLYQLHEELPYIKVIGSYRAADTTEE